MYFEVGEGIRARDATADLVSWCHENLVLDNPEYYKKERMGKWCGGTPRSIFLYETIGRDIVMPFGCISALMEAFPECRFFSRIKPLRGFDYRASINLYPYQKKAVTEAVRAKNGILVMPCGAGKTQAGLAAVASIGGRALWLTHTQDLLNQSLNRAKSLFGCCGYGMITGGKVEVGEGLTFATVQTMARLDLSRYKDVWDVVVVDECHKAVGSPTKVMQFYKVLSSLSCRYKYGLTATPRRADGLERSMLALLGGIIYEVRRDEVADTTCPVQVRKIATGYMPDYNLALAGDGTINYAGLVDDLTHNDDRYGIVFGEALSATLKGPTLILANRVEYLQKMHEDMAGCGRRSVCLSAMGMSKAAKAERKEALKKLDAGEIDCVLATYQLAKEGLDVPHLRYVVFATPEKDETTVMQAAGRVGRKADGKDFGTVLDFVDDFGMYQGWAKKRENIYRKLDYEILT